MGELRFECCVVDYKILKQVQDDIGCGVQGDRIYKEFKCQK
jgi:hypothetical protein